MAITGMTTPKIRVIDRQIDAIHRQLSKLEKIDKLDAESWQRAWDRHPALRAQEVDLYRQRGIAQDERDEAQARAALSRRAARPKKCPTCGQRTLRNAR